MDWSVYIILCSDGSLYTGISNNVQRRFQQHLDGKGAKYFRGRHPKAVVYLEEGCSRADASRRESAIKKMSRLEKLAMIEATS